MGKWAAAWLLLCVGMSSAAELPGIWREGEQTLPGHHGIRDHPLCSGGKLGHILLQRDFLTLPLTLPQAIERPRLFVRYSREAAEPAKVRVSISPPSVTSVEKGTTKLVDLDLANTQTSPDGFRWATVPLPSLAAGECNVYFQPVDGQSSIGVDVICVVDRATHNTWRPPAVKDGKLDGSGVIGPPVLIDKVESRSPLRLVFGDEVLGDDKPGLPLEVTLTNLEADPVEISLAVRLASDGDWGEPIRGPKASLKGEETRTVPFTVRPAGYGWFRIAVAAGDGPDTDGAGLEIGVIRRPVEGLRPDSLFGMNIAYRDEDLLVAQMIGVKWRRALPATFDPRHVTPEKGKWWTDAEIETYRRAIRKWRDAGILTLGLQNYNAPWNVAPAADGKPIKDIWRNRPADLAAQAEIFYRTARAFRDDITYWEIWNEPWVAGWTWQTGTAQDYREMSRLIWEKVKPEMPEIMLLGGGSTSYQRDILLAPGNPDIGYADGTSTHPYNSPDRAIPSSAAVEAELLKRYGRSGGKAGIWATEISAAEYSFEAEPLEQRKFTTAKAIAPIYLLNRIGAGSMPLRAFYFTSQWGQPVGGHNLWNLTNPRPGIVAYSAMTHFVEDGRLQGDLFDSSTAMWAPHFVKPDGSSVVAFWAEDGFSGRMLLPAGVFEAFDYLGAPTGKVVGDKLVLDFVRWGTIYLVSKRPADQVRGAVEAAEFEKFESLRINPRSFTSPLEGRPPLRVKVQNLLPRTVDAEVTLATPGEIELAEPKQTVTGLKSGEIRFLEFPVKKAAPSAINRYRIDYTATVGGQTQTGSQVVQAAFATFGTPTIDGQLDDWKEVTPVTMLSRGGKDYTEAALDPSKAAAILAQPQPKGTVAYRLWTRWDDANFYLAAEVPDEKLALKPPFATKPEAFAFLSDNLQMAFDCLEPNPDDFFVNHPGREKYLGSEVDYEFSAAAARDGEGKPLIPELHRLKAPGTNYQTRYETNVPTNPPLGPMGNVKVAVVHDAGANALRYEVAIPWGDIKELGEAVKALRPGQSHRTRFAFGVVDDGGRGRTYWTQEAGDLQSGAYGFSPTWLGGSTRAGGRILTDWGFVR